jgi:hypothetical protein
MGARGMEEKVHFLSNLNHDAESMNDSETERRMNA